MQHRIADSRPDPVFDYVADRNAATPEDSDGTPPLRWCACTRSTVASFLVGVLLSSVGHTQDLRVGERYPGASLSGNLPGADTGLYISVDAVISSSAGEYIALVYYQPYPGASSDRYASYALLKRNEEGYEVILDTVASDSGTQGHERPFLYDVVGTELVVFSRCYRGCRYSFFRLDDRPVPIALEEYDLPDPDEHFEGRGDVYRFEDEELIVSRQVSRVGDPSCCPSGGTVDISYVLEGDSFHISAANRTE